jgi:hypothetical protein
MIFNKDNLNELLRNNVATVTFTKVDGSERVMKCTLLKEYIPNAATKGQNVVSEETTNLNMSVWDVEAAGWRSFRINSVKSVSVGY